MNISDYINKTNVGMTKQEFTKTFSSSEKDIKLFEEIDANGNGIFEKEELAKTYYKVYDNAKAKAFVKAFTALGGMVVVGNSKSTSTKIAMGSLSAMNAVKSFDDAEAADMAVNRLKEILTPKEYQDFMKKMDGPTLGEMIEAVNHGISDWWTDKDKVCTDKADDGNIGFAEGAKSYLKGLAGGIIKTAVKNPIVTIATLGVATGATIITGGAVLPILVGLGALGAGAGLVKGVVDASTAKTDAEAKQAFENMGTSTTALALSALAVRPAATQAVKAGVKSLKCANVMPYSELLPKTIKAIPECFEVSLKNTKANIATWTTSAISAGSNADNAMSNGVKYTDPKTNQSVEIIHIRDNQAGTQFKTVDGVKTVNPGDVVVKTNGEFKVMSEAQFLKETFDIVDVAKPYKKFDPAFRDYNMVYKVVKSDGTTQTAIVPTLDDIGDLNKMSLLEQVVTFNNRFH